jgi:hypothetical protein
MKFAKIQTKLLKLCFGNKNRENCGPRPTMRAGRLVRQINTAAFPGCQPKTARRPATRALPAAGRRMKSDGPTRASLGQNDLPETLAPILPLPLSVSLAPKRRLLGGRAPRGRRPAGDGELHHGGGPSSLPFAPFPLLPPPSSTSSSIGARRR